MKNAIKMIFGVACGAVVGLALGVVAAMALGLWSKWAHPDDPSAGSVAIVVIATGPAGAILGAILGGLAIASRPRLFLATFLPLAIVFIGLQATLSTLRRIDRPRNFLLEVGGTPAAGFVGVVSVDGNIQKLKGVTPARFEFKAFRLELALALAEQAGEGKIAVKASADGNDLETGTESQTGVQLRLESVGYCESFGGTSRTWQRMSSEEVDHLIEQQALPPGW
jgi:hypothetical protein